MARKQVSRSMDGRVQGSISYWLNSHEDECWSDKKIKPEAIIFPVTSQSEIHPVKTYRLEELNIN